MCDKHNPCPNTDTINKLVEAIVQHNKILEGLLAAVNKIMVEHKFNIITFPQIHTKK